MSGKVSEGVEQWYVYEAQESGPYQFQIFYSGTNMLMMSLKTVEEELISTSVSNIATELMERASYILVLSQSTGPCEYRLEITAPEAE